MKPSVVLLFVVLISAGTLCRASGEKPAVKCDPMALSPCATAIIGGVAPSDACCKKLREQKPCLCQYRKDPTLRSYVNSQNSKKVAADCGVPAPNC